MKWLGGFVIVGWDVQRNRHHREPVRTRRPLGPRALVLGVSLALAAFGPVAHAQDDLFFAVEPPADLEPGSTMKVVKLEPGDSLASLAAEYGIAADDIRAWNQLEGAPEPEQRLVLWLPPTREEEPDNVVIIEQGGDTVPEDLGPAAAAKVAPAKYKVLLRTTEGDIVIKVTRAWAPTAADRFYNLVSIGFYDGIAFYRVVDNYLVQFGIHGNPGVNRLWRNERLLPDDRVKSNLTGYVGFIESRDGYPTTEIFVNTNDNLAMDRKGYVPFGKVAKGFGVVKKLYGEYGGTQLGGDGPSDRRLHSEGNPYLRKEFPELDYIEEAVILD